MRQDKCPTSHFARASVRNRSRVCLRPSCPCGFEQEILWRHPPDCEQFDGPYLVWQLPAIKPANRNSSVPEHPGKDKAPRTCPGRRPNAAILGVEHLKPRGDAALAISRYWADEMEGPRVLRCELPPSQGVAAEMGDQRGG